MAAKKPHTPRREVVGKVLAVILTVLLLLAVLTVAFHWFTGSGFPQGSEGVGVVLLVLFPVAKY
jgi:hypothetical protein